MTQKWDVVIVGGGHNGLVTAAYLARAGLRVIVLERRSLVGGACVTEEVFPGFKVSTAAYLCSLLHPRIIQDLDLPRHGYFVFPKDPAFWTPFPDGRSLTIWQDQRQTCQEIARFSRNDAAAYPRYEEHIERLAGAIEQLLLITPPNVARTRLPDLLRLGKLGWVMSRINERTRLDLIRILTQSAGDFLDPWFESDALKVTLATDGVIGTSGGPRSPGTAYILLHHVMGKVNGHRGLWGFVRGGMGAVAHAIASAARSAGAIIRTDAEVQRILVRDDCATAAILTTGEEIPGRIIVSNADPKRTFLTLVGQQYLDPDFLEDVRRIRMTGCSMKINFALDELPSFRAAPGSHLQPHHRTTIHICPSLEDLERAWDDAKYGRPSRQPLLEITFPTTYDKTLAPEGKHIMGVFLQYTPYHLAEGSWHQLKEKYADQVMDLIEDYAPGFKDRVLHRQILSPLDLEEVFGLTGGNIFHGDMTLDQLFSLRPVGGWSQYRTPIRNLYLCGAGTHPGGGVMGVPGFNAAREILRDWRRGWR